MPTKDNNINEKEFKEPMVIFPLKQYESLMEHIEDIEDRLAVYARANEPEISQQEVEALFAKKFSRK
jgi:hypothetical protein